MNFCTLFDSAYLDKGMALYNSLSRVCDDFTLYIFCFDNQSFNILKKIHYPHAVIIHHEDFETPLLLKLKKERSRAEYCWTCTPVVIEYILNNYTVKDCTYIDSDIYFYSDPKILFEEIWGVNADAVIVKHNFKDDYNGKKLEARNGTYCVQFNYFCHTENSKQILNWWKEKCFEWCYDRPDEDRMGDQKYLDDLPRLFTGVYVLKNLGAGVAPWNLEQYRLCEAENHSIVMSNGHIKFKLVFYHYQNIRYLTRRYVNIKSQTKNKKLKYIIYIPYLKEIEQIRSQLHTDYGLDLAPKKIVRSSNSLLGFLQKYFAAFKIRMLSDIINLNQLDRYC